MRKLYILTVMISFLTFTSCGGNDDNDQPEKGTVVSFGATKNIKNLYAPSSGKGYKPSDQKGKFIKFNFSTGKITNSETNWDIAFRWSTILVNGGTKGNYDDEPKRTGNVSAYIAKNTFEDFKRVEKDKLKQDNNGKLAIVDDVQNGKGIWSYNMKKHYVLPIPGRVLVFKTNDGKYVKMEVLSFYKNAPVQPKTADESHSYYTFRYCVEK